MKIKVLQAGRYNDRQHKAQRLAAGAEFETGELYGRSLVEAGLAERIVEAVVEPELDRAAGAEPDQIGPAEPTPAPGATPPDAKAAAKAARAARRAAAAAKKADGK